MAIQVYRQNLFSHSMNSWGEIKAGKQGKSERRQQGSVRALEAH